MVVLPDEAKVVFDAGYYAQLPRKGSRLHGAGRLPNWPCHPPLQPPLHTAANHCRASKVCIANRSDEVICTLTEGIKFEVGGNRKEAATATKLHVPWRQNGIRDHQSLMQAHAMARVELTGGVLGGAWDGASTADAGGA